MEITKSQKRLFIILGIVVAYGIWDFISNMDTYTSFYSGKPKAASVTQQQSDQDDAELAAQKKQSTGYLEKWGRDPFHKKVKKKVQKAVASKPKVRLTLYAISEKENNSVALINDKIVKIGDMIGGYTLIRIGKKDVSLKDGSKTITLKLDTN